MTNVGMRLAAALAVVTACATDPPPAAKVVPPPVGATAPAVVPSAAAVVPSATVAPPLVTPEPAEAKLNVIVITIDALRADHMPWLGYERDVAPNLTKFAASATSYSRAYALSSYTAMSMGGFLAGRYPGELERSGYFFSSYPDEVLFFPELLSQAGVHTLAGHGHFYFDTKAGFRHAFDDYRMIEGLAVDNTTDKNVTSPQHVALAKEMLSNPKHDTGQFFAWFHFMDPHDLYVRHEGINFGRMGTVDRYDGEIFYTDQHVGELLTWIDAQPWGERTAIVISSDHGEAFGEHKRSRHGFELYDMLVHVPLVIRVPGAAPQTIAEPRSHIDLAPTIHELMGVPPHESYPGTSLVGELTGKSTPAARDVIIDLPRTSDNFRRRAMVTGRHKLIAFGDDFRYEFYDVLDDPGELIDLRGRQKQLYKEVKVRYLERVKTIKDVCPKMRHRLKGKRPEREC